MKAVWTPLTHSPYLEYPRLHGMMAQIISLDQLGSDTKDPVYYGRLIAVSDVPTYDPADWVLSSHMAPKDQPPHCDPLLFEQAWDMDSYTLLLHGRLPTTSSSS